MRQNHLRNLRAVYEARQQLNMQVSASAGLSAGAPTLALKGKHNTLAGRQGKLILAIPMPCVAAKVTQSLA